MRSLILSAIAIMLFNSCHNANTQNDKGKNMIIHIQPLGDVSAEDQQYVYTKIKKVYPYVSLVKAIPLPSYAYYAKRKRYKADSLISYLCTRTPDAEVTIGLTNKDISTTKKEIKDYGIMGLGLCPGKACVASSYRLSKDNKHEQLYKVCIHELGHTQGLKHCPIVYCYMHDAEGHNTTDEETSFCPECKAVLVSKGWCF